MQNRKRVTDVQNRLLDSVGEGEGGMFRENSIETCILSRVKQTTSPGWMHETSARAWCTGKTQRDRVEREVGGGSGWGIHVNPWLIHVSVWQKPLQYCKVISLQLIKINGKKKKFQRKQTKKKISAPQNIPLAKKHILQTGRKYLQIIYPMKDLYLEYLKNYQNSIIKKTLTEKQDIRFQQTLQQRQYIDGKDTWKDAHSH